MHLTRTQKVRLGVFVIVGAVLTMGSIVLLAGVEVLEERDTYPIFFHESVSGLEVGSPVKYRGLRIGRIEEMRIPQERMETDVVQVLLSLEKGTPIFSGTQAVLDTSGLTGVKTVNLLGGDPREGTLEPGTEIPAGPSFVDRITGQAEQIAQKLEIAVNQLTRWTNEETRQRVLSSIQAVEEAARSATQFLDRNKEPMRDALQGVAQASDKIADQAKHIERTLNTIRSESATTLKAIRRPFEALDDKTLQNTLSNAERAMQNAADRLSHDETGRVLKDFRASLGGVNRMVGDLDHTIRAGREDFVSTLRYIRQAAEDLREFSRMIAQEPSILLRGKELRE